MINVISKTGQSWKFKTMFLILILSGALMLYGQMNIDTLSVTARPPTHK